MDRKSAKDIMWHQESEDRIAWLLSGPHNPLDMPLLPSPDQLRKLTGIGDMEEYEQAVLEAAQQGDNEGELAY